MRFGGNVTFVNGKAEGRGCEHWDDPLGRRSREGLFQAGELQGEGATYDQQGRVLCAGHLVNGVLHGAGAEYYENGMRRRAGHFVNGVLHGEGTEYEDDGRLRFEGRFVNGVRHGEGTEYAANGKPRRRGRFERGVFHGREDAPEYIRYDGGRMRFSSGVTLVNGKAEGQGLEYWDSSTGWRKRKGFFQAGELQGEGATFNEDGNDHCVGHFVNGVLHGEGTEYFYDYKYCRRHFKGHFVNGVLHGEGTEYYKNGNPRLKGHFVNGVLHGVGKEYDSRGNLVSVGRYVEGAIVGYGRGYHDNGKRLFEGIHDSGFPDKSKFYVQYSATGEVIIPRQFRAQAPPKAPPKA